MPYLWGGRTSIGLDCSALVQLSLMAAGVAAPRDTDMQRDGLGSPVDGGIDAPPPPRRPRLLAEPRGDPHRARIVHASGHHMTVVTEPLAAAVARIGALTGPPTVVKRLWTLDVPASPGASDFGIGDGNRQLDDGTMSRESKTAGREQATAEVRSGCPDRLALCH